MGKASATPGRLFDHSGPTTQKAGEVAAWVRGTLREYIAVTDRSVRRTAQSFSAAGGASVRGDLGIARPTTGPVTITNAALLAQEHSDDMAAGARLAGPSAAASADSRCRS